MGEDAEKKYLASLDFKISDAESALDKISSKLEELSKKSEINLGNVSDKLKSTFSGSDAQNSISKMSKTVQTEYAKMERQSQNSANKLVEIEAKKNASIEESNIKKNNKLEVLERKTQNALTNQVKEGQTSRIAEYAKTFLIYQGFNQLKQAAFDTVEQMKAVEYRMMEISRIMEDGSININQYRDSLIDLAYEYGRSFNEVSTVTLNFARAGYSANDALALTEKSLLALNTAELDAGQATDGLISIMAQWEMDMGTTGEKADNLSNVIDKINKTADNFPISSEGLLEALKRTSQGFNLAGASIDETIAFIVAAERASQRGGKVIGTAMANITQQLKAEGKLNLAESLGLDFYEDDAKTKFKSITDIFAEMSERMAQLKKDGKESSTEMQSLLELFTVFRRNIGAGLLSEMSGEDSTYAKALATSLDSIGYSAQENSKYMNTAAAATEQFNATLMKLQTSIWDNEGKGMFYTIINSGKSAIEVLTKLIDFFGGIPVAIGTATLAFSLFSKTMRNGFSLNGIKKITADIKAINGEVLQLGNSTTKSSETFTSYVSSLNGAKASTAGYIKFLGAQKVATVASTVATVAFQAALSLGLSLAITAVISLIDNLVNAQKKFAESNKTLIDDTKIKIKQYEEESKSINDLIAQYKELSEKEIRTPEINNEILSIQKQLKDTLGEQADKIDLINGKYDEQKNKVDKILQSKREQAIIDAETAVNAAKSNADLGTKGLDGDWFYSFITSSDDAQTAVVVLQSHVNRLNEEIRNTTKESEKASKQSELNKVNDLLTKTKERVNDLNIAQQTYNNLLAEDYMSKNFSTGINSIDKYKQKIDEINKMSLMKNFQGTLEEQKQLLNNLISQTYPELAQELEKINAKKFEIEFKDNTKEVSKNIKSMLENFKGLNAEEIIELGVSGTDEQKKAYKELEKVANSYEISISSLINKLVELKEVQGVALSSGYVDEIAKLKSALDKTSDSYSNLSTAIDSYNQNGKLTVAEVQTMLKTTPELAKYLIKVGDSYKLNKQALEDYNDVQERNILATDEYIKKLKEQQFGSREFAKTYNELLDMINTKYEFDSIKNLSNNVKEINNEFINGKISAKDYFNNLQNQIKDIGELSTTAKGQITEFNGAAVFGQDTKATSKAKEEIEGMQALFAGFTQSTVQGIEYIQAQFESGQITFVEYSNSIQEASDNIIDLYSKSNDLSLNAEGQWVNAKGEVDDYANTLQDAKDELSSFSDVLNTLGNNFDYISKHADAFGNAAFTAADEGTKAYQDLASNMTNSLNSMKDTNQTAFNNIVNDMSASTGLMTNEIVDSNGYINQGLLSNSNNLNAAITSSTGQVGSTVGSVTKAMGNVITALGNAIANFDYSLTGSLDGFSTKEIDILGNKFSIPVGLKFKISGQAGSNISGLSSALTDFGSQLSNIQTPSFNFGSISKPGNYKSAAKPTGSSGRGSGGGGSSRDTAAEDAKKAAEEAAKAAEEARKRALELFKSTIEERERLEDRWVKNKKALGLITDKDEQYILQESIKRYQKYAEEVNQLTFASEEEKAELRKKYLEEAEDLQVEYFELLKDLMEKNIDDIESKYDEDVDAYDKAIDEKIDKIKKQADAEIEALQKVEEENDRIRQKEEYEANRKELMHGYQGVEYWQQRTGREAQLALAEAKKKVEDLDKNWEETVNKWNVEDQIKLIEERRDADIAAIEAEREAYLKALEETKNAEIQALKDKYQYQLDYFNQTGQIIQDNATIQAQDLFNTYKKNFIDPVGEELRKALDAQAKAPTAPAQPPQSVTYTIKYGDTLSGIAARYGTTVDKIMAANPYITNRNLIYSGRQLRIPTSHTGSRIIEDGLVNLQAGEIVLNTNWAKGLDRMLGQFNTNSTNNTINKGNTIQVEGDLVKVEAKIEDNVDTTFIARRITRELKDKFDIKK